ncbi:hypothetical protein [Alkalihalobacillus sp. BA299]|uniref:hypothetical protein n=1 Tax=Alkalihalobacillus sp. BA299 TaxID=2815938 RepID=UPI001ADB8208|nr:hypothetical protein [Alkalihalobacillus sp. BA299]
MSLKNQWLFNIAMVLISWLSLPLVGKRSIKRFLPASTLAILLTIFDLQIGKQRRWWSFYNKPQSTISNEFPFLIGPMLVMSLLSLKWTYGNFKKFIMLNALFQAIFTFPITRLFTKLKVYKLVWFNELQFFLYFFYKAFFLYGFQYLFENRKELIGFTNMNREITIQTIDENLRAP